MKNSDLHTHSYHSDGELSPREVITEAKKAGIKNLALTDHNSFDGVKEAVEEGKKWGINVIPAFEIRVDGDEVLGYFIDYENKDFIREIKIVQNRVSDRVKKIILKLNDKGINVSFEDLLERYKPNKNPLEIHLIKYLSEKGYGEIQELWGKYIRETGETYVPIEEVSAPDMIKIIAEYGGVPVLAHPWVSTKSKKLLEEENFVKLVEAGLKGIEIDNGDRDERRDEKTLERIKELAKKYNLIITSGSDFHGATLIKISGTHQIGKFNCDEKVVEELSKLSKKIKSLKFHFNS